MSYVYNQNCKCGGCKAFGRGEHTNPDMKHASVRVYEHVDVEVTKERYREGLRHCVEIMARTAPVKPHLYYVRSQVTRVPCDWLDSWWAKAVRWCMGRFPWLGKRIPAPLRALVWAHEISIKPDPIELSKEVLSNVRAQIAQIRMHDGTPKMVIIGYNALDDVLRVTSCQHIYYAPNTEKEGKLFGYPLLLTQKLDPDSVLVV